MKLPESWDWTFFTIMTALALWSVPWLVIAWKLLTL